MATLPPPPFESNVQVLPSTTAGNGLFATKDIPAGTCILSKPRPLIGELDLKRSEDSCANCFTWSYKTAVGCRLHSGSQKMGGCEGCENEGGRVGVKACTGCRGVRYCGKACQKQAWARYHKHECKLFKDPSLPPLPNSVRAAVQLACLMKSGAISEEEKQSVRRLQAHTASTIEQLGDIEDYEISVKAAEDLFARLSPGDGEDEEIRALVGRVLRNSLTLTTPTLDPIGIALDPIACSANHSCTPNASVLFDVPRLMMRSLTDIKKGQEIFISYVDITEPFSRRRHHLKQRFCFTCQCPKCSLGPSNPEDSWLKPLEQLEDTWSSLAEPMDAIERFSEDPANYVGSTLTERNIGVLQGKAFQDLESACSNPSNTAAITGLENIMRICKQSGMWPITRQPYASARNEMSARLIEEGKLGLALFQLAKTYFKIDPVLYQQSWHPVRVVHTWTLAKTLVLAYSSPNDPSQTVDSGVEELFARGFDFVVPIWRLLKQLSVDVEKSHGKGSHLWFMVNSVVGQVRDGIGAENLQAIERDPLGMWREFEKWADYSEY